MAHGGQGRRRATSSWAGWRKQAVLLAFLGVFRLLCLWRLYRIIDEGSRLS